ncbi:MAG: hypothetical protein ACI90V_008836 [Bacillariaceae sp.]|jgi:hypothetical protein
MKAFAVGCCGLYGVVVVVPFSFQVLDLGVLLILLRRGWL